MSVPALGAKFTEYTAEFEAGGELGGTPAQRLIFVIDGSVKLEVNGKTSELNARGYAYLPEGFRIEWWLRSQAASPSSRNRIRLSIQSSRHI